MTLDRKSILAAAALFVVTLITASVETRAQSTLFNIPSTDVVATGKTYVEFDFISHFESHANGGFQAYVPRLVYGLGKKVEIGANVAFTDNIVPDQPVEFQPNIKYQFYSNEKTGVAAAVGGLLYIPVSNTQGTDTFGFTYSTVSKKFTGDHGPRLTGGAYGLLGRADGTGTKYGGIAGYEQPLAKRVSFNMDWFSGKNRFGYVTPGFSIAVTGSSALWAGYSIGNYGRKNNALFIYYGITF